MKRSSDYGNQHENIKKPRFGQSYNYALANSGMRSELGQATASGDLYSHQFPPVGPSAMMMANHSYTQGAAGFHPAQSGFAGMGGYHQGASQYAASMSQYNPGVNNMVPQFSADVPADEILNQVKVGPIESVRILPEKNCAFISFMDGTAAAAFYHDASTRKLMIHGQELKVGWGKPSPVPPNVQVAVSTQNASRNVYLGNLDDTITEQVLRDDLAKFGTIETVKIVREKNIGFVHFLTISSAIKAVQTLPQESKYTNKKVNYGKDRCAVRPASGNGNSSQFTFAPNGTIGFQSFGNAGAMGFATFDPYQVVAAAANTHLENGGELRSPTSPLFSSASSAAGSATSGSQVGNRTIYLGNIHQDTTCEEICNVIRGGILHQIRYMADKHIAFVTFVDPTAANNFMFLAQHQGVVIKNRRLKVGWGKNSGPLPGNIQLAVNTQNASRNVYVGSLDDSITEEKLRRDFSEFGEIELVNILKEKSCGFVNFTSIVYAIKAIEGIKAKEEYRKFRINYGKDRCGNAPRGLTSGGTSTGSASKTNKGRNSGESDARILHDGDTSESENEIIEAPDDVNEIDDDFANLD
ncbi:273_t:CDS:2 [Ambispora gerdemannii]|uniref:273_t:CDS:1 n=1 Tax=Ambispora gerdemannii TaxID=144530 RepID=A0A9N8YXG2_9GLOM|nr:273_t:CDS:2 [Ambispora gerdemannii]